MRVTSAWRASETNRQYDVHAALQRLQGRFLEIGGPTPSYDVLPRWEELHPRLDVINNSNQPPRGPGVVSKGDGQVLPHADDSVAAVFGSALPVTDRVGVLLEMARVLRPGGLLVWQRGVPADAELLKQLGLTLRRVHPFASTATYVFEKKERGLTLQGDDLLMAAAQAMHDQLAPLPFMAAVVRTPALAETQDRRELLTALVESLGGNAPVFRPARIGLASLLPLLLPGGSSSIRAA